LGGQVPPKSIAQVLTRVCLRLATAEVASFESPCASPSPMTMRNGRRHPHSAKSLTTATSSQPLPKGWKSDLHFWSSLPMYQQRKSTIDLLSGLAPKGTSGRRSASLRWKKPSLRGAFSK
jgi:hypothetical protein